MDRRRPSEPRRQPLHRHRHRQRRPGIRHRIHRAGQPFVLRLLSRRYQRQPDLGDCAKPLRKQLHCRRLPDIETPHGGHGRSQCLLHLVPPRHRRRQGRHSEHHRQPRHPRPRGGQQPRPSAQRLTGHHRLAGRSRCQPAGRHPRTLRHGKMRGGEIFRQPCHTERRQHQHRGAGPHTPHRRPRRRPHHNPLHPHP